MIALERYASTIRLHEPFVPLSAPPDTSEARACLEATEWLAAERGMPKHLAAADGDAYVRLRNLLTVRAPGDLPTGIEARIDLVLAARARARGAVAARDVISGAGQPLVVGSTSVSMWRGDITRLAVDAIVNAANEELLGCFRPGHACIDNAIHSAAGPRLRDDCARIVEIQGGREATGDAKITRGYHLPSRFVLHTVGPIVSGGQVRADDARALASCYEACLNLAREVSTIRTLAFCAISTGVFGYPKGEAAEVAVRTVLRWLREHDAAFDHVVFCVFSDLDERASRAALDACGKEQQR